MPHPRLADLSSAELSLKHLAVSRHFRFLWLGKRPEVQRQCIGFWLGTEGARSERSPGLPNANDREAPCWTKDAFEEPFDAVPAN